MTTEERPEASAVRLTAQEEKRLVNKRLQRGECPACGTKLFRFSLLGKKTPIGNRVTQNDGHCVKCIEEASLGNVPRTLQVVHRAAVKVNDDATMVSGLTLPIDLVMGARLMDAATQQKPQQQQQSVPIMEGLDYIDKANISSSPQVVDAHGEGGKESTQRQTYRQVKTFTPPPRLLQQSTLAAVQLYSQVEGLDTAFSIKWEPAKLDVCNEEEETVSTMSGPSPISQYDRMLDARSNQILREIGPPAVLDDAVQPREIYFDRNYEPLGRSTGVVTPDNARSLELSTASARVSRQPHDDSLRSKRSHQIQRQESSKSNSSRPYHTATDIQGYIQILSSTPRKHDRTSRVAALKGISDIILAQGTDAKRELGAYNGLDAISAIIWSDIGDHIVQESAMTVIFALVASSEGDLLAGVWTGDAAQGIIDALLVSMQSLIGNETIQSIGCKIFGCLAKASGDSDSIDDGSLAGAVWTVLNAMYGHEQCADIQESGIRALYGYCLHSKYAEANKRAVATSLPENGEKGAKIMANALQRFVFWPSICEWTCDLYRDLSAGPATTGWLVDGDGGLKGLLSVIWKYREDKAALSLLETALGAASNLLKIDGSHETISVGKALGLAFEIIHIHRTCHLVLIEAFRLVANLCDGTTLDSEHVHIEVKNLLDIYSAMTRFPNFEILSLSAMSALTCLGSSSSDARDMLLEPILYAKLMQIRPIFRGSSACEAMTCRLAGCLFESKSPAIVPVISDLVEFIISAVSRHHASESLVDAATCALDGAARRHAASFYTVVDPLPLVFDIMERYASSESIQATCCCIISLAFSTENADTAEIFTASDRHLCLTRLVAAVRIHAHAVSVLDPACNALHSLIIFSNDVKTAFLSDADAIAAVTSLCIAHPKCPALLEKVVEIISCISCDFTDVAPLSVTINDLIEVMRENVEQLSFMTTSLRLLCRVIESHRTLTRATAEAIPIVLELMILHQDEAELQQVACHFLLTLSRDKCSRQDILDHGGVGVLVSVLEHSKEASVQQAVLSAFNELAMF